MNALCDIWCGRVFCLQRDWLWTSGGLLVVSECVVVSGLSMLRPTFYSITEMIFTMWFCATLRRNFIN